MPGATFIASSTRSKLEHALRAAALVARLSTEQKNRLLLEVADRLRTQSASILRANQEDIERTNLSAAMRDRLLLTPARISAMADSVRDVARLLDPVDDILEEWTLANRLKIRKVRVPLGVVGIVYESRPNVTVDAAVLALKAVSMALHT
jgi:glutamate-5-semialdehyde dehydrogenase